ncbi:MAG: hypothetical protein R2771_00310 [Saprospiraceae bacterium]
MKKYLLFFVFFLLLFQSLLGQKKVIGQLDLNVGFLYISDIQINKILKTNDLPEVKLLNNYIGINIDVCFRKFIFSTEGGILNSRSKKEEYSTNVSGLMGAIGLGYSFLKTDNVNVGLLGFVSVIPTEIKLSYDKSSVDMGSLDPKINSGLVNLNYTPINFGINLKSTFFNNSTIPIGISFSYEIGINKPEVKSDYANISNPVKEKGDRLSIKLSILINKY